MVRGCDSFSLNLNCLHSKDKYVLDADISRCFDNINHKTLLQKLNTKGKVRQQIKAWLKSGVIDKGVFNATSEGTPQGGVLSPLLANIALHGMEKNIKQEFPEMSHSMKETWFHKKGTEFKSPNVIRYADDFLILHEDKAVVNRCREIIAEWLTHIGLELKPEKTRIAHTFKPDESEDGKAGFDFLGFHIQQYPAGKYRSNKNAQGKILGFNTLITPLKRNCKEHQEQIGKIISKHKSSPQAAIIKDLNPVIRGWTSYYQFSDAQTVGELAKHDHLTYFKLRRWAKRRCKNINDGHRKYWTTIDKNKWEFATTSGEANPLRLLKHKEFSCSSTNYVKVKGDKSPFDGDVIYWSSRLGKHPEIPNQQAKLLKLQLGKCSYCGLRFQFGDVLEVDHKIPRALGGKDEWKNLQLLHRHCHDQKTAIDLIEIRKIEHSNIINKLFQFWEQIEWEWLDDIPNYISHKGRSLVVTKETH
ncbi:MAG: group II intron reverse transcriptase [Brasilonema sp.]